MNNNNIDRDIKDAERLVSVREQAAMNASDNTADAQTRLANAFKIERLTLRELGNARANLAHLRGMHEGAVQSARDILADYQEAFK